MSRDQIDTAGLLSVGGIEDIFEQYQRNPASIPHSWAKYFQTVDSAEKGLPAGRRAPSQSRPTAANVPADDLRVYNLIHAYRTFGHLMAKINPIATQAPEPPKALNISRFGFTDADLDRAFPTAGFLPTPAAPLRDIVAVLQATYGDRIGVEYVDLQNSDLERWLQMQIEPNRFQANLSIDQKRLILEHLNKSELFESFLHTKFTGQKRFSLEGGETLIPILASILETGADLGMEEFYIGMAHRGRLNVLTNILNKSYGDIFCEFEEGYIPDSFEGSGDVKYHKGFSSTRTSSQGKELRIELTANPSHLEAVNPVVEGQVRARQILLDDEALQEKVVPILVHGDASVAGQGVVYETMQMYDLQGYGTGGTIHIVVNNQIGFTTLPKDARSTTYCTDIAKTFGAPVFHVNGEDPEGCVHATNLAVALRQKFHCDVFIELNCYRKYGHNESDEPAFTQPLEYQLINKKRPVREIYRDSLVHQGVLEKQVAEQLEVEFKNSLQNALDTKRETLQVNKEAPKKTSETKSLFAPLKTGLKMKDLQEITDAFCKVPGDFTINRKLKRVVESRSKMLQGDPKSPCVDWGMGEHLAFATLLWEGTHVRLSGQDSRRGTFSHRHSMWVDQKVDQKFFPLSHLKKDQGRFDVFNSLLSEYAVLGFEVGYSLANPDALVIWEAQFGDFCNGAQIIIDQFLATSEQKWGSTSGLVMLLPHGYEGQGPEHSSARMERFLQLCGDNNMQVVDPTTPAQIFHLLRRQVKRELRKPLVVFTPKGLLRHPACLSAPADFVSGKFEELLEDPKPAKKTRRLIFCTGRIFYDLMDEREKRQVKDTTIIRIEQLYPIHKERLQGIIDRYPDLDHCLWVQEEPRNMGAWHFIRPFLQKHVRDLEVRYAGRPRSASPAAGSFALHQHQHAAVMEAAFNGVDDPDGSDPDPGMSA